MKMKNIINSILIACLFLFVSCDTEQDVIETGVCNPIFDGNILEYLESDDFNWNLTVQMIKKAGMEDIFTGKHPDYKEITFFGLHNYSIIRHVWDKQSEAEEDLVDEDKVVEKLSADECKGIILQYIVKGKYLKEDLKYRDCDYFIYESEQTGFTEMKTEAGSTLRAYLERGEYANIPESGAIMMYLYSETTKQFVTLATPNIQPTNGVVHALSGSHILGKI